MQHIMSCSTPETAMATMRNAAEHAAQMPSTARMRGASDAPCLRSCASHALAMYAAASAGSERLLARFPQKSAVNTAGSNMTTMVRMKAKMGTSLHTMTMALSALASSTPLLTSRTMAQLSTEMKATPAAVRPLENGGKKYPMAVTSMTPNATLPIQMDSQYPQPETRPTNGPKPSRA